MYTTIILQTQNSKYSPLCEKLKQQTVFKISTSHHYGTCSSWWVQEECETNICAYYKLQNLLHARTKNRIKGQVLLVASLIHPTEKYGICRLFKCSVYKNMNTPSQELLRRRLANTEILATAAVALQRRSLIVSCLVMSAPPSADQSEALQIYWLPNTQTVSYSVLGYHTKYESVVMSWA